MLWHSENLKAQNDHCTEHRFPAICQQRASGSTTCEKGGELHSSCCTLLSLLLVVVYVCQQSSYVTYSQSGFFVFFHQQSKRWVLWYTLDCTASPAIPNGRRVRRGASLECSVPYSICHASQCTRGHLDTYFLLSVLGQS